MHKSTQKAKALLEKSFSSKEKEALAIEIASLLLESANAQTTKAEKRQMSMLHRMMSDAKGKAFTTKVTDEAFRSQSAARSASQICYLLDTLGVPTYLSLMERIQLGAFQLVGRLMAPLLLPLVKWQLRKKTSAVILPGEQGALKAHMQHRKKEGVLLNINHLGEAILGEEEAKKRLEVYIEDLKSDSIDYVSIKISTIYSQINQLDWEKTIAILAERLRRLYRTAKSHAKFVNLDMEEYRDLHLTKELFKRVLSEEEFLDFSAGIVLQAYLPDAHIIQKELTEWALERQKKGGASIKIRIVKGANLAMEKVEASLRGWPQAPYKTKNEVDANFKRMVEFACDPLHAKAVHTGIGSHNLFDIAYTFVCRSASGVEKEVSFEMLEGMADPMRRAVQEISKTILLYCPVAKKKDFQSAIAYLIRRLDENTGEENFLRHTFDLKPRTAEWNEQVRLFQASLAEKERAFLGPRRTQNRNNAPECPDFSAPFDNEPDTDFSLPENHRWAYRILEEWQKRKIPTIPLVIRGKEISSPASSSKPFYSYVQADLGHIDAALAASSPPRSVDERCHLLALAAQKMREKRGDLIGAMMADGGKSLFEADPEVSEAIDFAEYYRRNLHTMNECKDLSWQPKGIVLVAPPWNFPISIPAGGILAALAMGNLVIFKPAPEAVLCGWILVNCLWDAGFSKEELQFINCSDEPVGSALIKDPRLASVILTGATSTARLFLKMRPELDLHAETGGKNALIITAMADRDLAIRDLITSAFGHSGQKCSAASLAILEAEVYDDPGFKQQLRDATLSLPVGSNWDFSSKIVPLIRPASGALLKGLTTLAPGESWLVEPKQDAHNPNLWSPGVKWGVAENSFMHQTELFGPVLAVMRANDLTHALKLANGTCYGLTSGLHSLDEREQNLWIDTIEAGNCYINRSITGAIVRRQPFGGTKLSCFGGGAKAGGPNYLSQLAHAKQATLPQEKASLPPELGKLSSLISKMTLSPDALGLWYTSIANYAYWAEKFSHLHDPSRLIGQDNFFTYLPRKDLAFRIDEGNDPLDILRVFAAALSTHTPLEVSASVVKEEWKRLMPSLHFIHEPLEHFCARVKKGKFRRIRLLSTPSKELLLAAAESGCTLDASTVLASGRFELLKYLSERAISIDYHRYGNLGLREKEARL